MNLQSLSLNSRQKGFGLKLICLWATSCLLFFNLGETGYWLDEIFSVVNTADFESVQFGLEQSGGNRLFYYLVLWPWVALVGDHEFLIRAHTGLICIIAISVVYRLAQRHFGSKTAFYAIALMMINPFFLANARFARNYGLLLLLSIVSIWTLLLLLEKNDNRSWGFYSLTNTLMVLTHPVALPFLACHGLIIFIWARQKIPWLKVVASLVLAAASYFVLPIIFGQPASSQAEWLQPPDTLAILETIIQIMGGHYALVFLGLFAFGLIALQVVKMLGRSEIEQKERVVLLLVGTFIGPIILLIAISHFIQPAFIDRYLIVCFPPFIILVAYVVSDLKIAPIILVGIAILLLVKFSDEQNRLTYTEDWKGAVQFVTDEYQAGDTVGFFVYYGRKPFNYYLQRSYQESADDNIPNVELTELANGPYFPNGGSHQPDHNSEIIQQLGQQHERLWLVVYANNLFKEETLEQEKAIHQELEALYGPHTLRKNFKEIFIYQYQLKK